VRTATATEGKPVTLLINALHAKSGGGVTYLRNILPYFAADDTLETHICLHRDQQDLLDGIATGVRVHLMDFANGFWQLLKNEQTEVPRLARAIAADVVFSPANYGPIAAPNQVIMLRNALGVGFVEKRPAKIAYWALLTVATAVSILTARRVIAVSEYVRDAGAGILARLLAAKFSVIWHGVDDLFSPPGTGDAREDFLLAVSDIYVQKNFETLVLAIERLGREHPAIELRIAGRPLDDAYYQGLLRTISEKGLSGNIRFLGHLPPDELAALYRRCRAFVFPSWIESFGNPLVEAMASGAPVASSDAAAMPEIVGGAGLLFAPGDAAGMAEAIGRLLGDDALCRTLSRQSVARAKEFSWPRTAERTIAVIKRAAARGGG